MKKESLYSHLGLKKYHWGEAFKLDFDNEMYLDLKNVLDEICEREGLNSLADKWQNIDYKEFEEMLSSALQFNLGFTNHEVMSESGAKDFYKKLIKGIDIDNCQCFTNWYGSPWRKSNQSSFNSISDYAIDFAISIFDNKGGLFIYFLFED